MKRFSLSEEPRLALDSGRVARRLSRKGGTCAASKEWSSVLDREIESMTQLLCPRVAWCQEEVLSIGPDESVLRDVRLRSGNLSALLEGCELVTLFLLTAGEEVDHHIDSLREDPARQVIADAIGSEAAEATARWFQGCQESEAGSSGFRVTPRFSPGYGDFGLEHQQLFVSRLGEPVGVRLIHGSLVPRKSVSGVIGWARS